MFEWPFTESQSSMKQAMKDCCCCCWFVAVTDLKTKTKTEKDKNQAW